MLAGYFISSSLSVTVGDVTASISGVEVNNGALRMTNPKFQGTDKKNGAYVVSAEYADQDLKNPKVIRLHAIKANLSTPSGSWSRMEAVRGVFNSEADRLVMQEKITVATSSGVTGELTQASLNTKTQTLRSHQRVHFELTHGTVKANALTFNSGEHVLTFRGKVLVHIIKPEQDAAADGAKPKKTQAAAPQTAQSAPETTGATPADGVSSTAPGGGSPMSIRRSLGSYLGATVGLAALATVALLLATPLEAQTLTNSFGGLSQSSKEPIDIEFDVLVVHDQQKYATFKGNVKAVQGTTTLRAQQLDVHYVGGGDKLATGEATPAAANGAAAANSAAATGAASGDKPAAASDDQQAQITQIEAKGDVIINSAQDQTTTSDWALYDVPAQLVTVGGNVVLTQGQNVLKGDRLVIDLKTGESRFENPGTTTAGGRIRALFVPKAGAQDAKTNGKSSDTKSGEAKPAAKAASSGEAAAGRRPLTQVLRQRPTAAIPRPRRASRPSRRTSRGPSSPVSPNRRGQVLYPKLTGQRFN